MAHIIQRVLLIVAVSILPSPSVSINDSLVPVLPAGFKSID
jgi:hypothetical protein